MAALHIVSKSPHASSALADCLNTCGERATLLLIEDAVNAALAGSRWATQLETLGHRVYVLREDAEARGISAHLGAHADTVDYARFVLLCCEHAPLVSWY